MESRNSSSGLSLGEKGMEVERPASKIPLSLLEAASSATCSPALVRVGTAFPNAQGYFQDRSPQLLSVWLTWGSSHLLSQLRSHTSLLLPCSRVWALLLVCSTPAWVMLKSTWMACCRPDISSRSFLQLLETLLHPSLSVPGHLLTPRTSSFSISGSVNS